MAGLLIIVVLSTVIYTKTVSTAEADEYIKLEDVQDLRKFALSDIIRNAQRVLITSIVDGDTVIALFPDNRERQIRLLGINAPEVTTKYYDEQCFGAEATSAVGRILKGGRYVYIKADPSNRDADDMGRKLRYVYIPTLDHNYYIDLSEYLVSNGYTRVFREYPCENKELYLEHEYTAKVNNVGIWGECE